MTPADAEDALGRYVFEWLLALLAPAADMHATAMRLRGDIRVHQDRDVAAVECQYSSLGTERTPLELPFVIPPSPAWERSSVTLARGLQTINAELRLTTPFVSTHPDCGPAGEPTLAIHFDAGPSLCATDARCADAGGGMRRPGGCEMAAAAVTRGFLAALSDRAGGGLLCSARGGREVVFRGLLAGRPLRLFLAERAADTNFGQMSFRPAAAVHKQAF